MNWKNAFFMSITAFVVMLGWGIKLHNSKAPQPEDQQEKTIKTPGTPGTRPGAAFELIAPGIGDGAGYEDRCQADEQQLDAEAAQCRFGAWVYYAGTLQYEGDFTGAAECGNIRLPAENKMAMGFHIEHPCEFATMLSDATVNEDNSYDVYALLGMQRDPRPDHQGEAMLDLIFAARSNAVDGPTDERGLYYYDFTTPCPPMCGSEWDTTVNQN
ncbi:MAG: hypothetical protein H6565_06030 [Lewinellaceae bacterium]|nr:hypothetical protein [Lewinellaceae bacterium]